MNNQRNLFAVYYDGSCPLCRKEIAFYRKFAGADKIDWQDVSSVSFGEKDLSCQTAMARFHVRQHDGVLIDGGRAFIALWRQLPAFRAIGIICSFPPLIWIIDRAYDAFLPIRPWLQRLVQEETAEDT
ncbi:MAG: DUF393 domain-containing protein [Pseudomonadota bacterium]